MQFRKLAGYKRMLAANYESTEAFPKLRIFSKKNQKTYMEGSRQFSAAGHRDASCSSWWSSTSGSGR